MSAHIESPLPNGAGLYPSQSQVEQIEAALAAAKNHLEIIPRNNRLAIGVQQQIIARYEKQLSELKGGSWLS